MKPRVIITHDATGRIIVLKGQEILDRMIATKRGEDVELVKALSATTAKGSVQ